jgi:hypothetical protein
MKYKRTQSNLYDIITNFYPIKTDMERLSKMVVSSYNGLRDPDDGNHFSELTDLSSMNTLRWIKIKMENSEEGRKILNTKPRVSIETLNFDKLKVFNKNTLGYQYYKYMVSNNFSPDERPIAKYIPDIELAYICQRFKETHDFYHVLLDYGRTIPDEIAIKWFEALHLRLPSSSIASIFGSLKLSPSELITLYSKHLPHIIHNSEKCKFVLSFYFEERLEQNIDELRDEMRIIPLYKY